MSVVRELNHVAIRVACMEESLRLYKDLLGGKIIRDAKSPDGKSHFVYIQLAEGVIELIKGTPGADNLGFQHIAFLTAKDKDINSATDAVRSRGYQITVEPKPAASGNGYLAFFKDIGGTTFEFIQRDEDIRIPGLENESILEFDHISILVDDESINDTRELITGPLGMKERRIFEKPGTTMEYYRLGPDTIELLYGKGRPCPTQPIDHIAFRLPCVKEMHRYLVENGIAATEPKESSLGGFFITSATGPDGEIIEFVDRSSLDEFGLFV